MAGQLSLGNTTEQCVVKLQTIGCGDRATGFQLLTARLASLSETRIEGFLRRRLVSYDLFTQLEDVSYRWSIGNYGF